MLFGNKQDFELSFDESIEYLAGLYKINKHVLIIIIQEIIADEFEVDHALIRNNGWVYLFNYGLHTNIRLKKDYISTIKRELDNRVKGYIIDFKMYRYIKEIKEKNNIVFCKLEHELPKEYYCSTIFNGKKINNLYVIIKKDDVKGKHESIFKEKFPAELIPYKSKLQTENIFFEAKIISGAIFKLFIAVQAKKLCEKFEFDPFFLKIKHINYENRRIILDTKNNYVDKVILSLMENKLFERYGYKFATY